MFGIGLLFKEGTLGLGNAYAPKKKEWVGAALSLAGTVLGGIMSQQNNDEAVKARKGSYAKQKAYWMNEYKNGLSETTKQSLRSEADRVGKKMLNRSIGASKMDGDRSQVARTQENILAHHANVEDTIARNSANIQQAAGKGLMQTEANEATDKANEAIRKRDNIATVASNASNAIGGMAESFGSGSTAKWNTENDNSGISQTEKSAFNAEGIDKSTKQAVQTATSNTPYSAEDYQKQLDKMSENYHKWRG